MYKYYQRHAPFFGAFAFLFSLTAGSENLAHATSFEAGRLSDDRLNQFNVEYSRILSKKNKALRNWDLLIAVTENDINSVRKLIREGVDVDVIFYIQGVPLAPLPIAVRNGNSRILKALLEGGADTNKELQRFATPLLTALIQMKADVAPEDRLSVIKLLVDYKADLGELSWMKTSPIIVAALLDANQLSSEIVSILLKANAPIIFPPDSIRAREAGQLISGQKMNLEWKAALEKREQEAVRERKQKSHMRKLLSACVTRGRAKQTDLPLPTLPYDVVNTIFECLKPHCTK